MLSAYLSGENFEVQHAATGKAGLELAFDPETDLVLLDVVLSDMSGFTLLRELRTRSRVPVIMLTTQGAVGDRVLGLESGADDYIPKPFIPIEVLARIRSLLRRNHYASEEMFKLVLDDVVLTPKTRSVQKGGMPVPCTAAEFETLYALAKCSGTVVTKEDLTRSALNRASYPGDRGVDNLVHSLRRKLGLRDDGEDRFRAVRNVGYLYLCSNSRATSGEPT